MKIDELIRYWDGFKLWMQERRRWIYRLGFLIVGVSKLWEKKRIVAEWKSDL